MSPSISKFIRFGIVGTSGFLVDFSITAIMLSLFGVNEYIANAVGFIFGATNNYILNRRWTWRSKNPNIRGEFLKFFMVSAAGLGINSLVIFICRASLGEYSIVVLGYGISSFWVAKLIATAVVLVWNFLVNNYFTFRKS